MRSDPKTPTSRRTLPLPQMTADAQAAHPPQSDGSIFYTRQGKPDRHDYYGTTIFKEAMKEAGLPPGTTSHDLRHHYATVLLARGESVVAASERLGHEKASLVLSTYGHLMPDSEDRTRKAVDDAWGEPDDGLQRPRPEPTGGNRRSEPSSESPYTLKRNSTTSPSCMT
ncbi:MAG: hypothetical protein NVSMB55_22870 [Mycobacteriales bacterium]